MISVSPFEASLAEDSREVRYLLRRAEHEAVAAIAAADPRASDSHAVLARHYGEQSRELIVKLDQHATSPAISPRP